jgi:hypothetical protein
VKPLPRRVSLGERDQGFRTDSAACLANPCFIPDAYARVGCEALGGPSVPLCLRENPSGSPQRLLGPAESAPASAGGALVEVALGTGRTGETDRWSVSRPHERSVPNGESTCRPPLPRVLCFFVSFVLFVVRSGSPVRRPGQVEQDRRRRAASSSLTEARSPRRQPSHSSGELVRKGISDPGPAPRDGESRPSGAVRPYPPIRC